jgi:hypothetical protein
MTISTTLGGAQIDFCSSSHYGLKRVLLEPVYDGCLRESIFLLMIYLLSFASSYNAPVKNDVDA